jgi:hypothetical protein
MLRIAVKGIARYAPSFHREFFKFLSKVHVMDISE